VAETNRAPFDLAEAESELVSGFMTEHAAVIFVFFFLAEYASIVLMCLLISILFLGGYNLDFSIISSLAVFLNNIYDLVLEFLAPTSTEYDSIDVSRFVQHQNELIRYNVDTYIENLLSNPKIENIVYALIIGTKTSIMIFVFI
jgi:NADH-ubiquinone oxidoreductase chain 1